jgi:glycine cleavage system pyridoxal-binding protein P
VLAFTIHMTLLGEAGSTRLAELNHANAVKLADALAAVAGREVLNDSFFNEFTVKLPSPPPRWSRFWPRRASSAACRSRASARRRARRPAAGRLDRGQYR